MTEWIRCWEGGAISQFFLCCQLGPPHSQASGTLETLRLGTLTHHPALGSILYQYLVTSSDRDFTASKAKNLQQDFSEAIVHWSHFLAKYRLVFFLWTQTQTPAFYVLVVQPKECFLNLKKKKIRAHILQIRGEQPQCPRVGDLFNKGKLMGTESCAAARKEEALYVPIERPWRHIIKKAWMAHAECCLLCKEGRPVGVHICVCVYSIQKFGKHTQ